MPQSFALAKQRAQEYKWDVGDGPTAPSGAAGAGAAAPRGEGVAPESSSAPAPPTVPPASPLGPPPAVGSSAGDGEQAGVDAAAGAAAADGVPAAASAVQTPLPSHALRPGQSLTVPPAYVAPAGDPAGRGRGRGRRRPEQRRVGEAEPEDVYPVAWERGAGRDPRPRRKVEQDGCQPSQPVDSRPCRA